MRFTENFYVTSDKSAISRQTTGMKQTDSNVALPRYHELLNGLQTIRGLQLPSDGYGKLIHRQYSIEFQSDKSATEIIAAISQDLNPFCHEAMATFEKVGCDADGMEVGDEYLIKISGPWNGPVRVIDTNTNSFSLGTLDGHLEAGFIEFEVGQEDGDQRRFTIQSWATSASLLVWITYSILHVTKLAQTAMWTGFCTQVAKQFGDASNSDVQISDSSFRLSKLTSQGKGKRSDNQLAELQERGFNYEVESYSPDDSSWRHDSYVKTVGIESPGPPEAGGLFMTAKQIITEYRFPDPKRVTGEFDHDAPLEGRNMLLTAKFLGVHVQFAVRVVDVIDQEVQRDETTCREWGYAYRTLDGHWEVGQMTFLLRKNFETGEVLFLINAYSRPDRIPNLLHRFGFWLMGRKVQTNFAKRCLERLVKMTHEEVDSSSPVGPKVQPFT